MFNLCLALYIVKNYKVIRSNKIIWFCILLVLVFIVLYMRLCVIMCVFLLKRTADGSVGLV
jgi:hypothetical protein